MRVPHRFHPANRAVVAKRPRSSTTVNRFVGALGKAMPKQKASKSRSGEHARGAARINASAELPNTSSAVWADNFAGRTTTAEVMGDEEGEENASPQKPSYQDVAAGMKRPLSSRQGVGMGRGKSPKTIQRRIIQMASVLEAELAHQAECRRIEESCKIALANAEKIIVPEAERLGYSQIFLFVKYQSVRIYFAYRAAGHSAIAASEEGGWPSLYSGSAVREWANDFKASHEHRGDRAPKERLTFSPYKRGGHVDWLLSSELLERKARKWIGQHAERRKGDKSQVGVMNISHFKVFLCGIYDSDAKKFTERGLLTDVLESMGKTELSLETCRLYLHRLGYSYDFARKNVYADGFDRKDVIEHQLKVFLPAMADAERRSYLWVPMAWLEVAEHWPSVDAYRAWVDGGKPEVHVDAFEWKNDKTPHGIDRMQEWGPMGGALSSRKLPDEKPVIIILQDETTIRQYNTQKKCWRHDSTAHSIAPKNEGAAVMYSGYICEQDGGFPMLTEEDVTRLNRDVSERMKSQGRSSAEITAVLHDIKALREEGLITDLDSDGMPTIADGKVTASKMFNMPTLIQLQIGKNNEGYWDGNCQVEQAKRVQRLMSIKYPDHVIVHVYDWSSGHHVFDDDAVVAKKLNANPGGKQPLMHDAIVLISECGGLTRNLVPIGGSVPPKATQHMQFKVGEVVLIEKGERVLKEGDALIGKPKGAMQIMRELDLYRKGMSLKGPVLKDALPDEDADVLEGDDLDDEDDNDEEKGVRRDLDLSIIHTLSQLSHFKHEKCKLEKVVNEGGGECIWLSKFHACCNGIEYVWGNRKKAHHKVHGAPLEPRGL